MFRIVLICNKCRSIAEGVFGMRCSRFNVLCAGMFVGGLLTLLVGCGGDEESAAATGAEVEAPVPAPEPEKKSWFSRSSNKVEEVSVAVSVPVPVPHEEPPPVVTCKGRSGFSNVLVLIGMAYVIFQGRKILSENKDQKSKIDILISQQQFLFSTIQYQADREIEVDASEWVIKNDGLRKHFSPGILKMVSVDNGLEIRYEQLEDQTVSSTTYKDGVAVSQITFSKFGAPMCGRDFDGSGNVVSEYKYDLLGQVQKIG